MTRYEAMEYKRCGKSGLRLPRISLGGWHGFDSYDQTRSLCLRAFDRGIIHIDLANNYGVPAGVAETHVGQVLQADLAWHRDELIISSKAGYHMWQGPYGEFGSRKHVLASLDQSLRRLRLDYVDIFYSHRFDPETPLEETMGALHRAVVGGKALYVGISNYPAAAVKKAAKIMRKLGTPLLIHQCAYSLFNRGIEKNVLDETADRDMGLIAFSPLAQGLLTGKYLHGVPQGSRMAAGSPFLKPDALGEERLRQIRGLADFAARRGQSLARLALQWVLRDDRVVSALVGASRADQIDENVQAISDPPLQPPDLAEIESILRPPEQAAEAAVEAVQSVTPPRRPVAAKTSSTRRLSSRSLRRSKPEEKSNE